MHGNRFVIVSRRERKRAVNPDTGNADRYRYGNCSWGRWRFFQSPITSPFCGRRVSTSIVSRMRLVNCTSNGSRICKFKKKRQSTRATRPLLFRIFFCFEYFLTRGCNIHSNFVNIIYYRKYVTHAQNKSENCPFLLEHVLVHEMMMMMMIGYFERRVFDNRAKNARRRNAAISANKQRMSIGKSSSLKL